MATEPLKIAYGGDMMLFLGGTATKRPIAFSTSAKLEITTDTREISSKDSGYWKERLAGKHDWKAGTDALYTEPLSGGERTGFISTVSGSDQLTGDDFTLFLTELSIGDEITLLDGTVVGTILSIESDSAATLTEDASATHEFMIFLAGGATNDFHDLYNLMITRTPLYFAFAAKTGTVPGWIINTAKKNYVGQALITAISVNAPDNETTTYSVSLEGTGSLVLA